MHALFSQQLLILLDPRAEQKPRPSLWQRTARPASLTLHWGSALTQRLSLLTRGWCCLLPEPWPWATAAGISDALLSKTLLPPAAPLCVGAVATDGHGGEPVYLYVWAGPDNTTLCRDALFTIDASPGSPNFGKIIRVGFLVLVSTSRLLHRQPAWPSVGGSSAVVCLALFAANAAVPWVGGSHQASKRSVAPTSVLTRHFD